MTSPRQPRREPSILAAADPGLVARLKPLLPHARLVSTTPAELPSEAARLHPRVVLYVATDAGSSLEHVRRLKQARSGERMMLLTAPEASDQRLAALELGVDEALPLPIGEAELAGRLSLLLRRSALVAARRLPIADSTELDLDRRELLRDGEWVHLRPKEAGLLELLARSPGRVFTREVILGRVWGANHVGDPRTVDVHVRWLRSKLEADPRHPRRLLTVRGVGYRLEPPALTER